MISNDQHSIIGIKKNSIFKYLNNWFFYNFSLLPHRTNSIDGKKHVRTVPVRLRKAQNDEHSKHEGIFFFIKFL
jgi:hypothetical protein